MTELVMQAEESKALHLHMEWLSGKAGDVEFTLESGAGCGSALLVMGVKRGDAYVREAVDIRTIVEPWVASILAGMDAKENKG